MQCLSLITLKANRVKQVLTVPAVFEGDVSYQTNGINLFTPSQ